MYSNWFKTAILMFCVVMLLGFVGSIFGGFRGMFLSVFIGSLLNIFMYWNSDKWVLSCYHAVQLNKHQLPYVFEIVEELCEKADLPMPSVYLVREDQPNAFATGPHPGRAAVAVTEGLVKLLTKRELRGVLAHELAHVKHRDTLIATVVAIVAGAISSIAQWGAFFSAFGSSDNERGVNPVVAILVSILAPIAALLIQLAISRSREFAADEGGARMCEDPNALADALLSLEKHAKTFTLLSAEQHPETAQMMIMNPFSNGGGMSGLFRTHPLTSERVKRLHLLAKEYENKSKA